MNQELELHRRRRGLRRDGVGAHRPRRLSAWAAEHEAVIGHAKLTVETADGRLRQAQPHRSRSRAHPGPCPRRRRAVTARAVINARVACEPDALDAPSRKPSRRPTWPPPARVLGHHTGVVQARLPPPRAPPRPRRRLTEKDHPSHDRHLRRHRSEASGRGTRLLPLQGGRGRARAVPAAHPTRRPSGPLPTRTYRPRTASDAALLASLGCGNPTAVAELREGETVLDLGSGRGWTSSSAPAESAPTGGSSAWTSSRRCSLWPPPTSRTPRPTTWCFSRAASRPSPCRPEPST